MTEHRTREYEITRGALRALALAAGTDVSRPQLAQVAILGDHEGMATTGHIALTVRPACDDTERGVRVQVPREEALRIKSEVSRISDLAVVRQFGEHITVSVPTEIAVDGAVPERRVEVHAVDMDCGEVPDVGAALGDSHMDRPVARLSVARLAEVVACAKACGADYVDVSQRGDHPRDPLVLDFRTGGDLERIQAVLMPCAPDDDAATAPDEDAGQGDLPGTESRPVSLVGLTRRQARRHIRECTSLRTMEQWLIEEKEDDEPRAAVLEALEARIGELP